MTIKFSPAMLSIILPILLLTPFLTKAYHIDDPVYLWVAQHLHDDPLNFYGFVLNWYGYDQFVYEINQNPPLVSYFAAFGALIFGWSELGVHVWFLVPLVMFSLGISRLARRLAVPELPAVLVAVLTPLFLISATSVMSDLTMSALYLWSVCLWLRGLDEDSHPQLSLAAFLMALAIVTKYFAFSLVPLLFAYTLWKKRKLSAHLLYLVVPTLALVFFEYLSYAMYGQGLVLNAATYALVEGAEEGSRLHKLTSSLVFMGGCLISMLFYCGIVFARNQLMVFVIAVLSVFAFVIAAAPLLEPSFPFVAYLPWYVMLQYSLFLCLGCALLALAVRDFMISKDDASFLILLWVLGTFVFMAFINWSVAARNILPMLPPLALLIARHFPKQFRILTFSPAISLSLVFLPALLVSMLFAMTDVAEANGQREAADRIAARTRNYQGPVWFFGHWGFQYYMQQYGARPYTHKKSQFQYGDIIVLPTGNTNVDVKFSEEKFWHIDQLQDRPRWLNVMQVNAGAGFYSNWRGPLPLNVRQVRPDEYHIFVYGKFASHEAALSHVQARGYNSR